MNDKVSKTFEWQATVVTFVSKRIHISYLLATDYKYDSLDGC